jgi:hypothetical protein
MVFPWFDSGATPVEDQLKRRRMTNLEKLVEARNLVREVHRSTPNHIVEHWMLDVIPVLSDSIKILREEQKACGSR